MESHRGNSNVRKIGRQSSMQKDHGKRPQGVKKERESVVRKSPRLGQIQYIQEQTVSKDRNAEEHPFPSPTSNGPGKKACYSPDILRYATNFKDKLPRTPRTFPQATDRKRKRSQEAKEPLQNPVKSLHKRSRTSLVENTPGQETPSCLSGNEINPIQYWIQRGHWPQRYSKQNGSMGSLLARKKSTSSLRRKESGSSAATPSDQKLREEKSAPYKNPRYRTVLETRGSFMDKAKVGITEWSKALIEELLETHQPVHDESLFRDDIFDTTCRKLAGKNETRVMLDIMRLIVPSAEILATYGITRLECLIEGINEGWNNSIPFYGPRPQPDYFVGFRRSAFTDDQLEKIKPFIGDWDCNSFFMATDTLHFPFLTCEVKCGEMTLDIADRQNAHSMTLAVRGVVELYRAVKREKELHQEILAFSISHDHTTVRIYGHYALVEEDKTTYYRHQIRNFVFTELDGKEKWTAYRFIRNVYDKFVPIHLNRICAAIDQLPAGLNFEISQSELQFSQQSNTESVSLLGDESQPSQASLSGSQDVTTTTSFTRRSEQASKRPRKKQ